MTETAGDLWPRSTVKGSMDGKLLIGDIKGRGFLPNLLNRIVDEGRPR